MASRPVRGSPGASAAAAVVWLIALSALGRLAVAWSTGLCYDESYSFSCARHPDLSYFDHPPLSILLGSLSLALTGGAGPLVLRWPFIVLFAGTTWLMFLLGRRLFGPWPGFYAALLLNLAPVFSASVGLAFRPDGPLMFFWLACVWCLAHLLLGPPPRGPLAWWAAAGAMLGLAMLSKYTAVLLVAGAGLYVATWRDQRRWLANPGPYLALALAALLFAPVLVWNAQHRWISFLFQGTRGMDGFTGLHLDWVARNIVGQMLELLPWIWAALVVELVRSFGRTRPQPQRRFIAWLAVTPIVIFTLVAAYASTAQRLFHWGMPGYLLLFLPLGDTLHRRLAPGGAALRWGLGATAALSLLVMTVTTTHVATGWLKDGPGWLAAALAGEKDPSLECIDFTALEGAFAERGLLDRRDVFVFTDLWFRAGKVDYGLKGRLPVLAFSRSDPRSFAFFDRPERWLRKDGVFVTNKQTVKEVEDRYGSYFARISAIGEVKVGRRGRAEITLYLYRCQDLKRPYPLPYG